ncbi:MAG: hypothetical protein SCH71_09685 [Desulfobulbaceae bacterium]|nr:hypothetical protein [Desulfobulbaceae bacterium]
MNRTINKNNLIPGIVFPLLITLLGISAVRAAGAADFTLFYSNDIRGETEPCG